MHHTLPAHVYKDHAWFETEMERIFSTMWVAAGRSEQIPASGDFIRRDVAGASLLIVRGAAPRDRGSLGGDIRAFHNVCRHRGTRLCDQTEGTFQGSIQCPYHAWTYDLDGRLIGAPMMDEVPEFRRDEYPLRQIGCALWDGHIFINLSSEADTLASQLGDLSARFAPWQMANLRTGRRVIYEVAANWKLVVQNYNECLHCPIIHPLLNRMHHYLAAANTPSTQAYCGGAMGLKEGVETLSIDGRRRREYLPGLSPAEQTSVHYYAIYPNLLLTLHPDYMFTVTIWPMTPERTTLVAEWHFHADELAKPGFIVDDAVEFWDRTNREDWAISERSQRGITSRGYTPGPYSLRETQLWDFDQFVLSRVQSSE